MKKENEEEDKTEETQKEEKKEWKDGKRIVHFCACEVKVLQRTYWITDGKHKHRSPQGFLEHNIPYNHTPILQALSSKDVPLRHVPTMSVCRINGIF